ncbi:MAG: polyprenyl synthetase family protein [Porticoccaceae bacterium]|nr:polyprenyl synthetase family protein [Porticoccaceae bacterium]
MAVDTPTYLANCQALVDTRLKQLLPERLDSSLYQAMRYSLFNGGKRIRPALCYATAELFEPATSEATHRSACAVELIHAYSLIHDDLPAMDNDDLRRGKPTCHIVFGEATAILAGDGLQALAFEVLGGHSDDQVPAAISLQLVRLLASAAGPAGMVGGQALDLDAVDRQLDLAALQAMHNAKTGALINASIRMGALAAGATDQTDLNALARFSAAIGLAFQVQDDILDVESSTDALGKRQGADQALNKPTYTSLLGLAGAKARLAELHDCATAALEHFGARATRLTDLGNFIVSRNH